MRGSSFTFTTRLVQGAGQHPGAGAQSSSARQLVSKGAEALVGAADAGGAARCEGACVAAVGGGVAGT